jgi:hypothetical protein
MFHAIIFAAALDAPTASPTPSIAPSPVATATAGAEPTRRALPAPLDPAFIGGGGADFAGPTLGVPTDRGIRMYGWLDPGVEYSTSKQSNYPLTYDDVPNKWQLDQAILRFERQPDTVQTKKVDWGFRATGLYGADYRWTTQQGILSNQLLLRNQTNGFDPVEAYGMLYFPHVGQGTLVEVGRYISPPDIEAQLAPNNFLYTHSVMFDFDSYTQTGFLFMTKLSNYWTIEYAIDWGEDIAPWDGSAHFPTGMLLARYVSHSNRNSVLFGINSISLGSKGGQNFTTYAKGTYVDSTGKTQPMIWGHDNLQQQNVTWTHVFNPGFQNEFEAYYLYQYNAYVGGTVNNYNVATGGPPYLGAGGGIGAFIPGLSNATGFVDYLEYKLPRTSDVISFRTDYINDPQGERSGFATAYGSLTLGWAHHFGTSILIRPEIRTEKSFRAGVTPYDNGTKSYQSTFGIDAIWNFGNP